MGGTKGVHLETGRITAISKVGLGTSCLLVTIVLSTATEHTHALCVHLQKADRQLTEKHTGRFQESSGKYKLEPPHTITARSSKRTKMKKTDNFKCRQRTVTRVSGAWRVRTGQVTQNTRGSYDENTLPHKDLPTGVLKTLGHEHHTQKRPGGHILGSQPQCC